MCRAFAVGACLLLAGSVLWADVEDDAAGATTEKVVTSIKAFWDLNPAARMLPLPYQIECDVTYYDPVWRNLWIQDGADAVYVPMGDGILPIKAGQRIRVAGVFRPPNKELFLNQPVITVLGPAKTEAFPIAGKIGEVVQYASRLITADALVEHQEPTDSTHLLLTLALEGTTVVARVLHDPGEPLPQLTGAKVRFSGVCNPKLTATGQLSSLEFMVKRLADIQVLSPGLAPATQLQNVPVPAQGTATEGGGKPAAALSGGMITSIREFWNLSPEDRRTRHAFSLECVVTYFDPQWKLLWVQQGDAGAYVPMGEHVPAVKPGQLLHVEGTFLPPNTDVSFENAKVTVLGPAELAPISTASGITEVVRFQNRFVSVDGLVDRQDLNSAEHLRLTLSVDGQPVYAWLLLDPTQPVPQLTEMNVRIKAVYAPRLSPSGTIESLELQIAGVANVEVLHRLSRDPRFTLPVTKIGMLPQLPADRLVHLIGRVKAHEPGRYLRIQDATGQVDVITAQTKNCAVNDPVEAIGFPSVNGTNWNLERGLYRSLVSAEAVEVHSDPKAKIQLASQVLELLPEEARRQRPVQLTGVVTWSHPDAPFFFVQDASGGICVQRGSDKSKVRPNGRHVEVRGVTGMGAFAPEVVETEVVKLGDIVLPEARPVSLEHALTGAEESQWVEMSGYLRQVVRTSQWNELELTTSAGSFTAVLPLNDDVAKLVGSVVRLHGVCTANANERRKLTGIRLWVPSAGFVQVEEAAPQDLFAVTARSLGSVGQFGSLHGVNRRVKVSGVVLYHSPGHFIHLEDAGESLLVLSRDMAPLVPGDRVEAVGFLGRQGGRVVLRESVYRSVGREDQPAPKPLADPGELRPDLDGHLVRVEGILLDHSTSGAQVRLTIQAQNAIFETYFDAPLSPGEDVWPEGSKLRLTGVYEIKYDEDDQAGGFLLRLRTPGDVEVVQRPSWLTRGRVLAFASALTIGILLFMAWVVALRRQVQGQTEQIRTQLQREAEYEAQRAAELQRATKLEAVGLLAGGIAHDFNNLLMIVMGNLSLAALDKKMEPETAKGLSDASRAVVRARDLTQQLLTFSQGGAPIRSAVMLPEVVREVAEFATRGSKVLCRFDLASDLWPADVDKGQIGQVVQNIVINGLQAMPEGGEMEIMLRNDVVEAAPGAVLAPGRYLKLSIVDSGVGISPEDLKRIFDPYFTTKKQGSGLGLATVYSIIKKHNGHIAVESVVGRGTTFHLWLPAADSAPEPRDEPVPVALVSRGPARVLCMDDEETIRRLFVSICKRCGHEATAMADGAAAVEEYARAMHAGMPYDLVILDLTVPGGMGGRETMERLLKLDPQVKAIVSSGYSNDQVLSNYQAHGFRGMVAKPYEIADLIHAINTVLQGGQA